MRNTITFNVCNLRYIFAFWCNNGAGTGAVDVWWVLLLHTLLTFWIPLKNSMWSHQLWMKAAQTTTTTMMSEPIIDWILCHTNAGVAGVEVVLASGIFKIRKYEWNWNSLMTRMISNYNFIISNRMIMMFICSWRDQVFLLHCYMFSGWLSTDLHINCTNWRYSDGFDFSTIASSHHNKSRPSFSFRQVQNFP